MWVQRAEESFILCMCVYSSSCVYVCVCVFVVGWMRQTQRLRDGEVRGGTHPLDPPLLTSEQRDRAERSTANRIN